MDKEKKKQRDYLFEMVYELSGYQALGFKKKKNTYVRLDNGFSETIAFNTSARSNSLPNTNIVQIDASIEHVEYGKWRKDVFSQVYPSGTIGSSRIENLFVAPPPYILYDLKEDDNSRDEVIEKVAKVLKASVIEFFSISKNDDSLLENHVLPGFDLSDLVAFFIYRNKLSHVKEIIAKYQKSRGEIMDHIEGYHKCICASADPMMTFNDAYGDDTKAFAKKLAQIFYLTKIDIKSLFASI